MNIKLMNKNLWNTYSKDLESLLNSSLRQKESSIVTKDYPQVFKEANFNNLWIGIEGEELVAFASAYRMRYIGLGYDLWFYALGSIAVKESYRGKGIGKELISRVIFDLEARNDSDLLILWSDKLEFYEDLGFKLCGSDFHFHMPSFSLPISSESKVEEFCINNAKSKKENPFWEKCFELYSSQKVGVLRTKEVFKDLMHIPNSLYLYTDGGYIVVGKGEDFPGYIHEWVGSKEIVYKLIQYAFKLKDEGNYESILLPSDKGLNIISDKPYEFLRNIPDVEHFDNPLGFIRILSFSKFSRIIKAKVSCNDFILTREKGISALKYDDKVFTIDISPEELLFNGFTPPEDNEVGKSLAKALPIDFYLKGLDSV
jgi:GNAT superfamily N-acetyltransferase